MGEDSGNKTHHLAVQSIDSGRGGPANRLLEAAVIIRVTGSIHDVGIRDLASQTADGLEAAGVIHDSGMGMVLQQSPVIEAALPHDRCPVLFDLKHVLASGTGSLVAVEVVLCRGIDADRDQRFASLFTGRMRDGVAVRDHVVV